PAFRSVPVAGGLQRLLVQAGGAAERRDPPPRERGPAADPDRQRGLRDRRDAFGAGPPAGSQAGELRLVVDAADSCWVRCALHHKPRWRLEAAVLVGASELLGR